MGNLTDEDFNAMGVRMTADVVREQQKEIRRLERIEHAAMRVAIAREPDGVVRNHGCLDALVRALVDMPVDMPEEG